MNNRSIYSHEDVYVPGYIGKILTIRLLSFPSHASFITIAVLGDGTAAPMKPRPLCDDPRTYKTR